MKFKQRIKEALFGFLKNEIEAEIKSEVDLRVNVRLLSIPPRRPVSETTYSGRHELRTVVASIDLDQAGHHDRYPEPFQITYERSLESAKKKLFDEVIKEAMINTVPLLGEGDFYRRKLDISIIVAKNPIPHTQRTTIGSLSDCDPGQCSDRDFPSAY